MAGGGGTDVATGSIFTRTAAPSRVGTRGSEWCVFFSVIAFGKSSGRAEIFIHAATPLGTQHDAPDNMSTGVVALGVASPLPRARLVPRRTACRHLRGRSRPIKTRASGDADGKTSSTSPASNKLLSALCPLLKLFSGGDAGAPRNRVVEVATSGLASISRMPHGVTVQPECVVRKTQPTKPIVLYEFEACPFCRRVRETATQLDLQLLVKPCPKDALTHRDEAMNNGNTKGTFPYLVDENTGTAMGESEDIARYLWATYGEQTEFPEAVVSSTLFTGWMPTLLRAGRGMTRYASADTNNAKNNSEKNNQPNITLYNYEGNQFARLVRYVLRVFQIPPTLFYLSAGDCLSIHRPTRD